MTYAHGGQDKAEHGSHVCARPWDLIFSLLEYVQANKRKVQPPARALLLFDKEYMSCTYLPLSDDSICAVFVSLEISTRTATAARYHNLVTKVGRSAILQKQPTHSHLMEQPRVSYQTHLNILLLFQALVHRPRRLLYLVSKLKCAPKHDLLPWIENNGRNHDSPANRIPPFLQESTDLHAWV